MKSLDSFKSVSSTSQNSWSNRNQLLDIEDLKLGLGIYEEKKLSPAELFQ